MRALESRVPTHMGGHHGVRRTPCFPSPLSHSPRPRVCVFRCQAAAGCSGVLFHQCPPGKEGLFVYRSSPSVSAGETKRTPWCARPDLRDMAMRWPLASHLSAWAPVCFLLPGCILSFLAPELFIVGASAPGGLEHKHTGCFDASTCVLEGAQEPGAGSRAWIVAAELCGQGRSPQATPPPESPLCPGHKAWGCRGAWRLTQIEVRPRLGEWLGAGSI